MTQNNLHSHYVICLTFKESVGFVHILNQSFGPLCADYPDLRRRNPALPESGARASDQSRTGGAFLVVTAMRFHALIVKMTLMS